MAEMHAAPRQAAVSATQSDISRENAVLRDLVTVYRHLSGLALQNADIGTVTRLLSKQTEATAAIVDPTMEVLAAAAPDASEEDATEQIRDYVVHPRLSHVLTATGQTRRALRLPDVADSASVIVAPILVGDEVPAYLMTLDKGEQSPDEDISLLVTEHAATICGVILGRERVVTAASRRVREDLVEGLLLGRGRDGDEVRRWAGHLGYDPTCEHRVVSVTLDAATPGGAGADPVAANDKVAAAVEHFFTTRLPEAIISTRSAELAVVVPVRGQSDSLALTPGRLSSACVAHIEELYGKSSLTVGIGGPCRGPAEIARSYAEACRTVDAMQRLGRHGQVVAFEDLGIHRLLLQVPDLAELSAFADSVLGRLRSYERDHRPGYLETLQRYFWENSSPQRAARDLFLHPNTVAYRIKRIEEITGLNFESYRDRLMAQVALEILDAIGDER